MSSLLSQRAPRYSIDTVAAGESAVSEEGGFFENETARNIRNVGDRGSRRQESAKNMGSQVSGIGACSVVVGSVLRERVSLSSRSATSSIASTRCQTLSRPLVGSCCLVCYWSRGLATSSTTC